ncbi:MAG: ABC transporter permease, partial [Blastocatellia bacterium]
MGTLMQDVRYALRMLRKNPGFTLIAVLTLALGIGANTAIFSVINAELLQPLPFRDPGQLVQIGSRETGLREDMSSSSYPDFADWRAQNHVFSDMAAYQDGSTSLTGVERPAHLEILTASAGLFDLLGAKPELGRAFVTEEDQPHHHVAILSDHLWR